MADIRGSETEKNLLDTFGIESELRTKYDLYSIVSERENYGYITRFLQDTAKSRKEHSRLWLKWLYNGNVPHIEELLKNLLTEQEKLCSKYEQYAQKAKEEGYDHVSDLFSHIHNLEKKHQEFLRKIILSVEDSYVQPAADGTFKWECSHCGAYFQDKNMPEYCPLCHGEDVFFFKVPN